MEQDTTFWVSKPSKLQSKAQPLGHCPTPAYLIFWDHVPEGQSPKRPWYLSPNQGQRDSNLLGEP